MVKLYTEENLSTNKIAQEFETNHGTIKRYLKSRGVNLRGMSEAQFVLNKKEIPPELYDKEYLQKLHWEENKSCKEIGRMFNIDAGTLRRQMHRLGIKTKTNAESKVGLMVGDTHPNWQGGRTPLKNLLREFFTNNQAPVIAKRDNHTCQLCGAMHVVLHVHHIIKFSDIVDEICEEHPDLNPDNMDDRLELYSIITHDKRFLDENNLITFCEDCHLFKIHNYTKRKTISSQASNEEGSTTIP